MIRTDHQPSLFGRALFSLAVVTLIAVGIYDFLPYKQWDWIPSTDLSTYVYSDTLFGGVSEVQWIDKERLSFACEIKPNDKNLGPFCGIRIEFNEALLPATDLSAYEEMTVSIDYQGENESLRFYLMEFVPGFSSPENPIHDGRAKYENTYVPTIEVKNEFTINLDEFIVADWWVTDKKVPRQYISVSRQHIMALGIDIVYPVAIGHHDLTINSIRFSGPWVTAENWYLSIVLIWVSTLIIGGIARYYYLRRFTSILQKEKDKYRELSMVDSLTGLFNRQGLSSYIENELATGQSGWPVSMVLIDVDFFKHVNDNFGHKAGDIVLKEIADIIKNHSRKGDITARWGGEEFLVLLPNVNMDVACGFAERLRKKVMSTTISEISSKQITISCGIVEVSPEMGFDDAFNLVDKALYQAKHEGRNRVICSTSAT